MWNASKGTQQQEKRRCLRLFLWRWGNKVSGCPNRSPLCFAFVLSGGEPKKIKKTESFGDFLVVEMLVMAPVGFAQRCGLLYPRSIFRIFGSLSGGLKVIALHSPFFALQLNPICGENGARFDFAHFFWHPEAPEIQSVA